MRSSAAILGCILAFVLLNIGASEASALEIGRVMNFLRSCKDDASTSSTNSSQTDVEIVSDFPAVQHFWRGAAYLLLGSGIRYYRLGFLNIKVYALALYVEQQAAVVELARLKASGFFDGGELDVDRACAAIAASNCNKVAQIQLLRSITSSQFTGALAKSLRPRLADSDDKRFIPGFEQFFSDKSLSTGVNVPLLWTDDGKLQFDLLPPGELDFQDMRPAGGVPSLRFSQALFDIYLSKDTPVTGAREQWAANVRKLLNATAAVS